MCAGWLWSTQCASGAGDTASGLGVFAVLILTQLLVASGGAHHDALTGNDKYADELCDSSSYNLVATYRESCMSLAEFPPVAQRQCYGHDHPRHYHHERGFQSSVLFQI